MQRIKENMEKHPLQYISITKVECWCQAEKLNPPLHRAAATLDSTPSSGEHQWTLILFLTVESRPEN